jgi:hypothetical protein
MYNGETFLVLGGAGLVGIQVCREISRDFAPKTVVVASLVEAESIEACDQLKKEFPKIRFVPEAGNLFVPQSLAHVPRGEIRSSALHRGAILDHIFGDFDTAYANNTLATMIRKYKPAVMVDSVNTATAISYQDVFGNTTRVRELLANQTEDHQTDLLREVETLMMSQGAPQLIRHLRLLYQATREVGTQVYVKVGTTGTGGMGLNIPYTHSEDRPSNKLLNKTEIAFGHTGLLFLLARTPDGPIVKEVKPAAMIGYNAVRFQDVRGRDGKPQYLYEPHEVNLRQNTWLGLREEAGDFNNLGQYQTTVISTGENGVFTRGEFGAITALGQMEFVTPEEIARTVSLEIRGATTGRDIISALDGAVIEPSYRAGMIRTVATEDLAALEAKMDDHSVALGQLGPPELSKLLFEVHLIKAAFGSSRDGILFTDEAKTIDRTPTDAARTLAEICSNHRVRQIATSVGIPILLPDGNTLLRGPRINVPELSGLATQAPLRDTAQVERWIRKGWIDLRPENVVKWQKRFRRMIIARDRVVTKGSAAFTLETYLSQEIEIGEVVAWIFNNEMDGSRMF